MLQGIFNYDNPVWRFIGKLGDLIILNILWIVCSIPVFTAGASTTAVYYVTLKLVRDEDDSTIRSFFRSFKSNFKQATAIWLILLAAGIVLGFDFWFFVSGQMSLNGAVKTAMTAVSGGLLLIYLFIITYVFPLQARFYNPVKRTLFNAFFMSVRHLFQTIGILQLIWESRQPHISGCFISRSLPCYYSCLGCPHCFVTRFLHCYFQEVHA